jgi:Predicted ester cyclase
MSEQNTTLVHRAITEVWNKGNYDVLSELVAQDIVIHSSTPSEDIHGPEGIKQFYSVLRMAFPDLHFTVEDQIAHGDRVVTRWTARGTHAGEFQGIPPTGKQVTMSGIDIDRIVNGKVVECWPIADDLNVMQQLGVLSAPDQEQPR